MATRKKVTTSQSMDDGMYPNPYSIDSFVNFINENFSILLIVGLAFIGGFLIGSLWTENRMLKGGSRPAAAAAAPAAPTAADNAAAPAEPAGPTAEQLASMPPVSDEDYVRGAANAKVTLVEYSDFECPFCERFSPTVKAVLDEYPNDVNLVYRHFPLSFHPQAEPLAEASECVGSLGGNDAFWQYHDILFERIGSVTADNAAEVASEIGISAAAVQECMDNDQFLDKVQAQMAGGTSAGVAGTPGTIVVTADGPQELISGALPEAQVFEIVEQYL